MTPPRFLVMAQPPWVVREACQRVVHDLGLNALLQGAMFDPVNWHQTLSDRFYDRSQIEPLRCACARVRAQACTLTLNRIRGDGGPEAFHWAFHALGRPPGFSRLLEAVKQALAAERLDTLHGHRPHITISYWAPLALRTHKIRPIPWTIDEILLVEGHRVGDHDEHYRYDVIDRWPLLPLDPARQLDLFDGDQRG